MRQREKVIAFSAKWFPGDSSRRRQVIKWLIGPRFIDLPIRVLAVLDAAVTVFLGISRGEPRLTLMFTVLSAALLVVAAFAPTSAAAASTVLFVVFIWTLPGQLPPFQANIEFAAAMLLTQLKWIRSLAFTCLLVIVAWAAHTSGGAFALPFTPTLMLYVWARNSVLALVAAFVEYRFAKDRRSLEQASLERERESRENAVARQRERVSFAMNTHDTVSHGLAQQGQLLKVLACEWGEDGARSLLSEMSLVNEDTQQLLRAYLSALTDAEDENGDAESLPARQESLQEVMDALRRAAEIGGIALDTSIRLAGDEGILDPTGHLSQLLREMVTNMVKHAPRGSVCELSVNLDRDAGVLALLSRNPMRVGSGRATGALADAGGAEISRTLALRTQALGGVCSAQVNAGKYSVTIRIPKDQALLAVVNGGPATKHAEIRNAPGRIHGV